MAPIGLSMKSYSVELADYLGITPLAVYERQRVLVRLGVLDSIEGRGPHSGVRATPSAVAVLLVGALFADNLSEIDDRVVRLLNAKPTPMERRLERYEDQQAHLESAERQLLALGRKPALRPLASPAKITCPITGAGNFRDAVAALLTSETLASQVEFLIINRSLQLGIICTRDARISPFGKARSKKPRLEVEARFPGELVMKIASDLNVMSTIKEHSS